MGHPINKVQPSTSLLAFNCPHCGAYTTHTWFEVISSEYTNGAKNPHFFTLENIKQIKESDKFLDDKKEELIEYINRILTKKPFLDNDVSTYYGKRMVCNLNLSMCYHCQEISIWVHDKLIYPEYILGEEPNYDMPEKIRKLYNEAREIANSSPIGAAALLRLCIQYLCVHFGEDGNNLNNSIANLVKKGLNPLVQKSLDIVRVIGNEAVHPGVINLDDNRDVAFQLFGIINIICEQMITHPKTVSELYRKLPEDKRKSIEQRDSNKDK